MAKRPLIDNKPAERLLEEFAARRGVSVNQATVELILKELGPRYLGKSLSSIEFTAQQVREADEAQAEESTDDPASLAA